VANPDDPNVDSPTGAEPAYLPAMRNATMIYELMQKAH